MGVPIVPLSGYCFVMSKEQEELRTWIRKDTIRSEDRSLTPKSREFYKGQVQKWKRFLAESK